VEALRSIVMAVDINLMDLGSIYTNVKEFSAEKSAFNNTVSHLSSVDMYTGGTLTNRSTK
jgi:hypothetical protein